MLFCCACIILHMLVNVQKKDIKALYDSTDDDDANQCIISCLR